MPKPSRRPTRGQPTPARPGRAAASGRGQDAPAVAGRGESHLPAPPTGRHRRIRPPTRSVLLSVLAVLTLLLGSTTAITLTSASPTAPAISADTDTAAPHDLATGGSAEPTVAGMGTAPPGTAGLGTAPPSPEPEPEPTPAPEPTPEPTSEHSGGPREQGQQPDGQSDERTALEDEVTAIVNQERAAAGCDPVVTDERLRAAARAHSEDMAANDYFDHTGLNGSSPGDRMRAAGYPRPAGENIAMGYRTPQAVMEGWMNSDGHRRNLLNCSHQAIGVGLAHNADGRAYWTQVFGR